MWAMNDSLGLVYNMDKSRELSDQLDIAVYPYNSMFLTGEQNAVIKLGGGGMAY